MNERSPNRTTAGKKSKGGARGAFGDVAPKLAEITEEVLLGDIWERPQLSKRDRSLATCAGLVVAGKLDQLGSHLQLALRNGLTREELVEMITHMAFYAGWPNATAAAQRAQEVFATLDD